MSKLSLALSITALSLGICCAHLASGLQQQRAYSAALLERIHALQSAASRERAALQLPTHPPASRPQLPQHAAPDSKSSATDPLVQMARRRHALLQADLLYGNALLKQYRNGMERLYSDLGTALGLPEAEAKAVISLLAQQQAALLGQRAPDELRRLQQRLEKIILSNLGAQGTQQWQEFENTLEVRHQLEAVRLELRLEQVPLRDDQIESMVKALAESDRRAGTTAVYRRTHYDWEQPPRPAAERLAALEQEMQLNEQITLRKRDVIASYLSAQQQALVERLQKQVQESYRSAQRELRMNVRAEAQGAPPAVPSFAEHGVQPPLFALGSGLRLAFNGSLHVRAALTEPCEALNRELNAPATVPEIPTTQY